MLALVVTAVLTVWAGAVSITELQSAPSEPALRAAHPRTIPPPDDDTVVPVTLADLMFNVTDESPETWLGNCESYNSWFENIDEFQLNPRDVLTFTEMLDMHVISAYEPDNFRLTPAARDWLADKLHDECTGATPVG